MGEGDVDVWDMNTVVFLCLRWSVEDGVTASDAFAVFNGGGFRREGV